MKDYTDPNQITQEDLEPGMILSEVQDVMRRYGYDLVDAQFTISVGRGERDGDTVDLMQISPSVPRRPIIPGFS